MKSLQGARVKVFVDGSLFGTFASIRPGQVDVPAPAVAEVPPIHVCGRCGAQAHNGHGPDGRFDKELQVMLSPETKGSDTLVCQRCFDRQESGVGPCYVCARPNQTLFRRESGEGKTCQDCFRNGEPRPYEQSRFRICYDCGASTRSLHRSTFRSDQPSEPGRCERCLSGGLPRSPAFSSLQDDRS